MRPSTRERALRTLVSALINSTLSTHELDELSEEISHSYQFQEDLRRILRSVSLAFRDEPRQKELNPPDVNLDHLLGFIKRRRYAKDDVVRIMNRVATRLMPKSLSGDAPLKEILRDFWGRASEDEQLKFFSVISPKELDAADEYLRGISNR